MVPVKMFHFQMVTGIETLKYETLSASILNFIGYTSDIWISIMTVVTDAR